MITYRDMTFCGFYKGCLNGKECDRALTKEIEIRAANFGLPICQFLEKPECYCDKKTGIGAKIS
jgi:hypothetical protein